METELIQQLAEAQRLGMIFSACLALGVACMSWSFFDLVRAILRESHARRRCAARRRRTLRDARVDVIPTGDSWS